MSKRKSKERPAPSALVTPPHPGSVPQLATRFVAATGAGFDDEAADIYGRELVRIAEANKVDDVRSLDKHLVYSTVEADEDNPLRAFIFAKTDAEAVREYRIERCAVLIRSVRVVTMSGVDRPAPIPLFIAAPTGVKERLANGGPHIRSRVLNTDLAANAPLLDAAYTSQINSVQNAIARLDHIIVARGTAPDAIVELQRNLKDALAKYRRSFIREATDSAAEE